jgi:uncharacterized protein YjdB
MMRTLRQSISLTFAAATCLSCADGPPTGPPGSASLQYTLSTVNGVAPPALVNRTTDALGKVNYFIMSATLTLDMSAETFQNSYSLVQTRDIAVPSATNVSGVSQTDRGTWQVADTLVTLRYDDGSLDVGRVTVGALGSLTFTSKMSDGTPITYVYELDPSSRPAVVVTVVPNEITLPVGERRTLIASVGDTHGSQTGAKVVWSVSNPSIATVSAAGVVTGITPGTTTVFATTLLGATGSAKISVTP